MFSSESCEWETPQDLFDEINKKFYFTLDACATSENAKVKKYFTKADDGLSLPWDGRTWCNPPYGREIGKWVEKAYREAKRGAKTVMLIPSRTDTKWFHEFIYQQHEIRFIKGRLKFGDQKNSAPFPSAVLVYWKAGVYDLLATRLPRGFT